VEQVVATIRVATVGPAQHVTVTLSPRELGIVEIHVARQDGGPATVALAVERPETLSLLRRDAPALQSALDRAGLPVAPQHVTMVLAAPDTAALGTGAQGDSRAPPQRPEPPRAAAGPAADTSQEDSPSRAPAPTVRAGIDITA
jgi:flagellar hook-length control protein FliK